MLAAGSGVHGHFIGRILLSIASGSAIRMLVPAEEFLNQKLTHTKEIVVCCNGFGSVQIYCYRFPSMWQSIKCCGSQ